MAGITFLFPGQKYLVALGGLYLVAVGLLGIPYFQRHILYLNAVKLPLFADFDTPEKYGLAPNRTVNLKLQTSDNESIGAWFVFSDPYYRSLPSIPTNPSELIVPALKHSPVVLFFHGNAATRAFTARVRHYQAFASRLGANVLAVDYRGFADSTGTPSEVGLVKDARTAFDWLVKHGKKAEDILIVGHSLGTGVSGQLGAELANDDVVPRGIVLLSPFSSITEVLETYNMFGFVPLTKPLAMVPGAMGIVRRLVVHTFDTLKAVPNITAPVLIAHAEDDWDIPDSHSDILFQAFLDPYLPPVEAPGNPLSITAEMWTVITEQQKTRRAVLDKVVQSTTIPKFGRVDEFNDVDKSRKIVLVKTHAGGHDYLGIQEGLVDIIGKNFNLL